MPNERAAQRFFSTTRCRHKAIGAVLAALGALATNGCSDGVDAEGADTSVDGGNDDAPSNANDASTDRASDGASIDPKQDAPISRDTGSVSDGDGSPDGQGATDRDATTDARAGSDANIDTSTRPDGGAPDGSGALDAPRADATPTDGSAPDRVVAPDAPSVDSGNSGPLVAFPGAQGFGRFATGGRGGTVYHVTNLDDSGAGSLRDAISQANRIIVFDVGGVIRIGSRLVFKNNQTIAGQTAPGGGITIYGDGTSFSAASNTIVRYVRFRMGIGGESGKDTVTMANGHDVIWDHCSLSWGRDGTFDLNQESGAELYNLTLQDSIVAQGLQTHSTGGLVNTQGTSILRSLYIDNNSRNPKARGTTQFVNNVIYNWVVSAYILGDTSGRSDGYVVGNYFVTGPETSGGTLDSPTPEYHIFADGNFYDNNRDGTLNGRLLGKGDFGTVTWETAPSATFPPVVAMTAQEAVDYVRAHAGASRYRDDADKYVMNELASFGKTGKTISDEATLGLSGGAGTIPGGTAPVDTDRDGMPDAWETANGLNPNDASDANKDRDRDGFTNVEEYINSLAP
ncbi:MAG: pectate lyase [Polyangiaceae bacterium]